jgi:hypothetical protein
MEKSFDEWNEKLRQYLKEKQEKLAVNFQARKLQEYRESVSELQVLSYITCTSFPDFGFFTHQQKTKTNCEKCVDRAEILRFLVRVCSTVYSSN